MYFLIALLALSIPPFSPEVPNRQPQLAVSGASVAMAFGSGTFVLFSRSTDRGDTFSKPVVVANLPGLMLGRHRGPRIAYAGRTIVASAIESAGGNLVSWRSTDDGTTWSKPVTINDQPGAAREGLHSIAADDQGRVAAVWLDLRSKGTRLYGSLSNDGGSTWSPNFLVYRSPDDTICQCCHPSIVTLGGGEFGVMFRNAIAGHRDMYTLRIRGAKQVSTPVKSGRGTWELNACPMDGGGLAVSGGKMISAWRRDGEIFLVQEGGEETRIGKGKDVALAANGPRSFLVWTGIEGVQSWISGRSLQLSATGTFPVVAALPDGGALVAWEENGAISVRHLAAPE